MGGLKDKFSGLKQKFKRKSKEQITVSTSTALDKTQAAKVLGVSPDAPKTEIKAAYREAVMKSHPDKGGSTEKFQKVTEAYKTLESESPTAIAVYDKTKIKVKEPKVKKVKEEKPKKEEKQSFQNSKPKEEVREEPRTEYREPPKQKQPKERKPFFTEERKQRIGEGFRKAGRTVVSGAKAYQEVATTLTTDPDDPDTTYIPRKRPYKGVKTPLTNDRDFDTEKVKTTGTDATDYDPYLEKNFSPDEILGQARSSGRTERYKINADGTKTLIDPDYTPEQRKSKRVIDNDPRTKTEKVVSGIRTFQRGVIAVNRGMDQLSKAGSGNYGDLSQYEGLKAFIPGFQSSEPRQEAPLTNEGKPTISRRRQTSDTEALKSFIPTFDFGGNIGVERSNANPLQDDYSSLRAFIPNVDIGKPRSNINIDQPKVKSLASHIPESNVKAHIKNPFDDDYEGLKAFLPTFEQPRIQQKQQTKTTKGAPFPSKKFKKKQERQQKQTQSQAMFPKFWWE